MKIRANDSVDVFYSAEMESVLISIGSEMAKLTPAEAVNVIDELRAAVARAAWGEGA